MAAIIDFGSFKGSIMRPRSSVKASVSDGDTVSAVTGEAFGVRFLGVDTPETKIPGPPFSSTSHPEVAAHFQRLLDTARIEASGFHPQLAADLKVRYPDGAAGMSNHHEHAKAAEAELEAQMLADEQPLWCSSIRPTSPVARWPSRTSCARPGSRPIC
jgi:hypothetical protein